MNGLNPRPLTVAGRQYMEAVHVCMHVNYEISSGTNIIFRTNLPCQASS